MSLNIRLKKARLRKGLTQQQLADVVGIKQQAVQRIEAGKVKSTTYMVALAKALDVSADWLNSGPGNEPLSAHAETDLQNTHYSIEFPTVPVLEWNELNNIIDIVAELTGDTKRKRIPCSIPNSNATFAVQLIDDSMLSHNGKISFLHGDIIIADPNKPPHDGSFVLAKTPQLLFRKYVNSNNGSYLQALNAKYKSIACDKQIHVLATVIERISMLL